SHLRHGLTPQSQPEQTQIDHQHGPADQTEPHEMDALDEGEEPLRAAHRDDQPGALAPLKERQHRHRRARYRASVTQPASTLMIAGCGCLWQSNQSYAIRRPDKIMTAHRNRATP